MTRDRSTGRALRASIISVLLCFAMLLGTTYAWFTDSIESVNNIIISGNLDIELYWSTDAESWKAVEADKSIFADELWEPGRTEVVYLKIVNEGSLALKYQLGINVANEEGSINIEGNDFLLSEHIMYGVTETTGAYKNRLTAREAVREGAMTVNNDYLASDLTLYPKDNKDGFTSEHMMAMVVYMPEAVGNAANAASDAPLPYIELGINLTATQYSYEKDSFDDRFDMDVQYPVSTTVSIPEDGSTEETPMSAGKVVLTLPPAIAGGEYTLSVPYARTETNEQSTTTVTYEITLLKDGEKISAEEGVLYPVEILVGTGLNIIEVTHNGEPIDFTYNEASGIIYFETDSFSPFAVTYVGTPTGGGEDTGEDTSAEDTPEDTSAQDPPVDTAEETETAVPGEAPPENTEPVSMYFDEFCQALMDGGGSFDGNGGTVWLINKDGRSVNNLTTQFIVKLDYEDWNYNYVWIEDVTFSFGFAEDETATAAEGELVIYSENIEIINCTFEGTAVSPYGITDDGMGCDSAYFNDCSFINIENNHPINRSMAKELAVFGCSFENCHGGICISSPLPTYFAFENNWVSVRSDRGFICLCGNGSYENLGKISIASNGIERITTLLRVLNNTVTAEQIDTIAGSFRNFSQLLTSDSIVPSSPDSGDGNEGEGGEVEDDGSGNVGGDESGDDGVSDEDGNISNGFQDFLSSLAASDYNYDGKGTTTVVLKYSEATEISNGICLYYITNESSAVTISNVEFIFTNDSGSSFTASEARLCINSPTIAFYGCKFSTVSVNPYGKNCTMADFEECDFRDIMNGYAINDSNARNLRVYKCTFTDCAGGIYTNSWKAEYIGIEDSSFTGIGDSLGAICIGKNSVYTDIKVSVFGNSADGCTMLRQLNSTATYEQVSTILSESNTYSKAYTTDSIIPEKPSEDTSNSD